MPGRQDNPDRWDPDETGMLWGRQHHTLDMELFGPNSWLDHACMSRRSWPPPRWRAALGEAEFAEKCERAGREGRAPMSTESSTTAATIQKLDLDDKIGARAVR